jgi:hypothetical protein
MFMKLESYRQIFEKSSNIKFHENALGRDELFYANGRKDILTKLSHFSQFLLFCKYFRTHHFFCPMQHKVTGIDYGDEKCILHDKTRVFNPALVP